MKFIYFFLLSESHFKIGMRVYIHHEGTSEGTINITGL